MENELSSSSFFTIPFNHIVLNQSLPYDLFVNSSILPGKDRFVRVVKTTDIIDEQSVKELRVKYHQLYIKENHRTKYLRSLVGHDDLSDSTKTTVIKESALHYLETIFDQSHEFTTEILNDTINDCREVVETLVDVIQDYSVDRLYQLIAELSYHDFYTYDHSINVSMYCVCIYQNLNSKAKRKALLLAGMAGLLHDLGKLHISTSIINYPGKLSDEQFKEIRKHPGTGKDLLLGQEVSCEGINLNILAQAIHEHHENYNGTGYPEGKKGRNIHILARIIALADFFDAITTKRSYHEVLTIEKAVDVMAKSSGIKLDPDLFFLFMAMLKKLALKDRTPLMIDYDFDPCQPHSLLPAIPELSHKKEELDFGKIYREIQRDDQKKAIQSNLEDKSTKIEKSSIKAPIQDDSLSFIDQEKLNQYGKRLVEEFEKSLNLGRVVAKQPLFNNMEKRKPKGQFGKVISLTPIIPSKTTPPEKKDNH